MLVRVWQEDQGLVDETVLEAGDFTQVKPGKVHQFEGIEDGVAFELYWAEFNHNDIVKSVNPVKSEWLLTLTTSSVPSNESAVLPISISLIVTVTVEVLLS